MPQAGVLLSHCPEGLEAHREAVGYLLEPGGWEQDSWVQSLASGERGLVGYRVEAGSQDTWVQSTAWGLGLVGYRRGKSWKPGHLGSIPGCGRGMASCG